MSMKDFRAGFDHVMATVKAQHRERTGSEWGSSAWLAKQLKTSRQTIDNYRKRKGFPYRYAKKLMRITGLTEADIWPNGITSEVSFPTELWDKIIEYAQMCGRTASEAVVDLVKSGLKTRSVDIARAKGAEDAIDGKTAKPPSSAPEAKYYMEGYHAETERRLRGR